MSEIRAGGSIQDAVSGCIERYGERLALAGTVTPGPPLCLTYKELGVRAEAAARVLREAGGGEAPRHVGFCLGNCTEYVVLYCGALYAGCLPLLLDANFGSGEIEAIRDDCGLDALVIEAAKAATLAVAGKGEPVPFEEGVVLLPLSPRQPPWQPRASTQVCRFTSGTTGRPKCIEFSGQAVVAAARNWVAGTGLKGEDRTLCLAALSNGLAFNTSLLSTFLAGAELHFHKGVPLTRPVAQRVRESRITRLIAFPTLYRNFAAPGGPERAALASLRQAISAGAPLWPDVREEFRNRYGLDVSDYYGIAETGPCTFERDPHYHSGLGEPLPGVEIRIAPDPEGTTAHPTPAAPATAETPAKAATPEPPQETAAAATGEVLVRTESMASGYLNHPGLFEQRIDGQGFYHSGDRGRLVDGRLHLVGRTQDHINVGGRKIDPTEIVAVVSALAGVEDAVAFPDEDLNREALVHLVVVAGDRQQVTRAAVIAACRSRLAHYKVPGRISFVTAIPRTAIGKPRIALLREQLNSPAGGSSR